ncbi:hypothetical protein [Chlorogloeopsis sp. ULAP02]|uniref:hypothetical protein n=1 Tax=Chlorogloeopsis sp. ULAP02 TaxID=3107926 RepID=UPI003135A1FF
MTPEILESSNMFRGAWLKETWGDKMRHLVYSGAWKKLEPVWDVIIRAKQVNTMLPVLER